jgi:glycosyltransferase involved in cell wall biosynthesis
MEALSAAKPVLTVNDSGGLLDIVRDGDTGLVVHPDPESLAAAIDRLASNRNATIEMGKGGRVRWSGMNVTWPATIERLLA